MNTPHNRTRRGAAILFSGILVLGGLALAGEATAGEEVEGNPTCEGYDYSYKVDPPTATTYTVDRDGMLATFTVGTHPDQTEPNKNNAITAYNVSTAGDYVIIVKGGDGATVYGPGALIPLHAPAVSSDKWPTISHFQLCWDGPPVVGQLQVTKVLDGDVAPTIEYEICIEGVNPVAAEQCQKVAAAATVTFKDLVPGTYKVTETNPGDGYTVAITPTDTVVVTAGQVAKATVTNTYKTPTTTPPLVEEVVPPTVEVLPPTAPVTPTTPVTPTAPTAPVTPAAPTQVAAAESALPTTGSEGGLAAIAAVLVAAGVGLTLLSKRRGAQQA